MAARVNTKFVAALITVLMLVTGALAVTYMTVVKEDPAEYVAKADAFYEQGQYERAAEQYGKALKVRTNEVGLIMRYVDSIGRFGVKDSKEANRLFNQMMVWWGRALEVDPTHKEAMRNLMQLYAGLARDLGDVRAWDRIYEKTNSTLTNYPEFMVARKWYGIAQANRMRTLELTDEERNKVRDYLRSVLKQDPGDTQAAIAMSRWYLIEARRLDATRVHADRAEAYRAMAVERLQEALEHSPGDFELLDALAQTYERLGEPEDAQQIAGRLEAQARENLDNPKQVLKTAELMIQTFREPAEGVDAGRRSRWTQGMSRAEALLEKGLDRSPDHVPMKVAYGRLKRLRGEVDEALRLFDDVRQAQVKGEAEVVIRMNRYRMLALQQCGDLLLAKADGADDPQQKQDWIDQAENLTKELEETVGQTAPVNLLRGKIAMARRDWEQAANFLENANQAYKGSNNEALLLSAEALRRVGTIGAAAERLEQLIERWPEFLPARLRLAEIRMASREMQRANRQVSRILELDPTNPQAREMKVRLLAHQGELQDAITLLELMDLDQQRRLVGLVVQLYHADNRLDEARQFVAERLEEQPTNLALVQLALRLSDDPERQKAILDRAGQAGASSQALALMRRQVDGDLTLDELLQELEQSDAEPLAVAIQKYRLLSSAGRDEEAQAALDRAAEIAPKDETVVRIRFERALGRNDFEQARELVRTAEAANLDLANGLVYRGQLELAQGRYDLAVTTLTQATKVRPLENRAWRMLGDAYRRRGEMNQAESAYDEAIRLRPDNWRSLRGMAAVLDSLGQHGEALQFLRRAHEFARGNRSLSDAYLAYEREHGDPRKVVEYRRERAERNPQDFQNRRKLALLLADLRRFDQARQVMDRVESEQGMNLANAMTWARLERHEGDPEAGRDVLLQFVNGKGEEAQSRDWIAAGSYLRSIGRTDQALSSFRRAAEIEDPQRRLGTRQLADMLFDLDQLEEAIELYRSVWEAVAEESERDPRVGLRLAEALIRTERLDQAGRVLNVVTEHHSANAQALLLQGMIARRQGEQDEALAKLERAQRLTPSNAMIYFEKARVLEARDGRDGEVIANLNRAIELNPDAAQARVALIRKYRQRDEIALAISEAQSLLARFPGYTPGRHMLVELYRRADRSNALQDLLADSAEAMPEDPVWRRYQVQEAVRRGDFADAVRKQQRVVELSPSSQSVFQLARLQVRNNDPESALATLRRHSERVSREPMLQAVRSQALAMSGREQAGERAFARALQLSRHPKQGMAVVQQLGGTMPRAALLEQLEAIERQRQTGWLNLAIAQLHLQNGRTSEVETLLQSVARSWPNDDYVQATVDRMLAMCYFNQGRHEEAEQAYRRLLERRPDDVSAMNNLAYLLAEHLERPGEALEMAQRAAERAGEEPQVLDTLGWVQFKLGRTADALRTLERSFEIRELAPTAYHLAMVLKSRGRDADARNLFERAVSLSESSPDQTYGDMARRQLSQLPGTEARIP